MPNLDFSVSARGEFGGGAKEVRSPSLSFPIFRAIRDPNPSASSRRSPGIGWAEPCCRHGKRRKGGVHRARGYPACARRLQRQWRGEYATESWGGRISGTPGRTNGLIEYQRTLGRRGWFFTMSSAGLGDAGLRGRKGWEWAHYPESCAGLEALGNPTPP